MRVRQRLQEEQGFALVLALGVTVVLSMMVVTVLEFARSNSRNATLSGGRLTAYNLAEAGISNAMSVLRVPTNNARSSGVWSSRLPAERRHVLYDGLLAGSRESGRRQAEFCREGDQGKEEIRPTLMPAS